MCIYNTLMYVCLKLVFRSAASNFCHPPTTKGVLYGFVVYNLVTNRLHPYTQFMDIPVHTPKNNQMFPKGGP